MPFDVLPQETKIGKFQKFADALLRGCAMTTPISNEYLDGKGGACAVGAMLVGLGEVEILDSFIPSDVVGRIEDGLEGTYRRKYGRYVFEDNDSGEYTREQIAARIAAL
jgi:hypothetical protein